MPTLKQLTCRLKWAETNTPFQEYGTLYGDGVVETFIVVPDKPQTFTISLTSTGFICSGLAVVVFVDGNYQCNRNRINLKLPEKDIPRNRSEVDFHLRQKEKPVGDGIYLGREWRFDNHNIVTDVPHGVKESHFDLLGTIEVLILRCQSRRTLERTLSTSSSGADSVLDYTGVAENSDEVSTDLLKESKESSDKPQNIDTADFNDPFGGLFGNLDGAYDDFHHDHHHDHQREIDKDGYHNGHWARTWQSQDEPDHRPGYYGNVHGQRPLPSHLRGTRRSPSPPLFSRQNYSSANERNRRFEKHVHFDDGHERSYSPFQSSRERHRVVHHPESKHSRYYLDHHQTGPSGQNFEESSEWYRRHEPPHTNFSWPQQDHYTYDGDANRYSDNPQHFQEDMEPQDLPSSATMLPNFSTAAQRPFPPFQHYVGHPPPQPLPYRAHPRAAFVPGMTTPYLQPHSYALPRFSQGPGYFVQYPPTTWPNSNINSVNLNEASKPNLGITDFGGHANNTSGEAGKLNEWDIQNNSNQGDANGQATEQNSWNVPFNTTGKVADTNDWQQNNSNFKSNNTWESQTENSTQNNQWSNQNQDSSWPVDNQNNNWNDDNKNNDWNNVDQNTTQVNSTGWQNGDNSGQTNGWENNWNSDPVGVQANGSSTSSGRTLYGPYGEYYTIKSSATENVPADAEEEPRYDVPQSIANSKNSTKQVQPGKGYIYSKKRCSPEYIDSFEAPYARFVFKYRTKEQLKTEIKIDLETEPTGNKEVQDLQNMEKGELIELLLLAKGTLGGKMPDIPPKTATKDSQIMEAVPIDPPKQDFLKYTLPPLRNKAAGVSGVADQWGAYNNNQASGWDGAAEKDETKQPTVQDEVENQKSEIEPENMNPFQSATIAANQSSTAEDIWPGMTAATAPITTPITTGFAFADPLGQPSAHDEIARPPTPSGAWSSSPAAEQGGSNHW